MNGQYAIKLITVEDIMMSQKLVIVGGGAAGPSSAAEAKRRNPSLEVTMIEKGDFVSYAA